MRPSAFELEVDGLVRKVQVAHERGRFEILLDGVAHSVDAVAIEPGRWSLLFADGRSHEVVIVTSHAEDGWPCRPGHKARRSRHPR